MLLYLVTGLSLVVAASASYHGNLNYRSPSSKHPSMGVDIPKVAKRSLQARTDSSSWDPNQLNFTHGVASGDPYPHSVILWTRISPMLENDRSNATVEGTVPLYNHDTEQYIRASSNPVCVEYRVAGDQGFSDVADHGTAYTTSDIDYTVKVCADHGFVFQLDILTACRLRPRTLSPTRRIIISSTSADRTKLAPWEGPRPAPLLTTTLPQSASQSSHAATTVRLSSIPARNRADTPVATGYFNAYGNAARKDNVDYVVSSVAAFNPS